MKFWKEKSPIQTGYPIDSVARNDEERVRETLILIGVEFKRAENEKGIQIICSEGNRKVNGYPGFHTTFRFEKDGTFIDMGAR